MPEFILDHGSEDGTRWLSTLDDFTTGYVEALFFADTPDGESWAVDALSSEARETIVTDCAAFQERHAVLIERAAELGGDSSRYPYNATRAGADFWLTRQGHGAGYWDRGLDETGDALTAAAHACGECWPYMGDDGKIYL